MNQENLVTAITSKERRETKDRRVQKESQGRRVILENLHIGEGLAPEVIQDIQGHQEGRVKRETSVPLVHLET